MINGMRLCLYTYVYIYTLVLLGLQGFNRSPTVGTVFHVCVGVYYCPQPFKHKTTAFAAVYELIFFFQPWNHIMKNDIYCLIFVLKLTEVKTKTLFYNK